MNAYPVSNSYVSAQKRANLTKLLLIVGIAIGVLSILSLLLELAFPPFADDQEIGDNPAAFVVLLLQMGVGIIQFLVYVATIVVFCMWLHRSYRNLPALGARNIAYSPGWAVGSFFVPFVNLIIPYRAVKELWEKSLQGPSYFTTDSPGAIFPLWWLFWLLGNFLSNACFRVSMHEGTTRDTIVIVCGIADVLTIAAAIFAIAVVTAITKRQEESSKSMNLGQPTQWPVPPPPTTFEAPQPAGGQTSP